MERMERMESTVSGGWRRTPGAPAAPPPVAAALPRAFRRTPDLARDMAECLLIARRRGARLTPDDAYWLARLRRRYRNGGDDEAVGV
jgi:hypothetical protein